MDADERLLMDAILADPDADEPRLRFAEWVEACDPERASFIRHQLANPDSMAERDHPFVPWGARDVMFRRGFAEGMSLTGRSFVSLSDGLFAVTPLRDVRLIAVNFLMGELCGCANLSKLDRLDLRGNRIGLEGVRHLAACPFLTSLRELDLSQNGLDDDSTRLLRTTAWARGLSKLIATGNGFTPAGEAELRAEFGNRVLL
jgi:uncharacterized protein (TIGR02996 family)